MAFSLGLVARLGARSLQEQRLTRGIRVVCICARACVCVRVSCTCVGGKYTQLNITNSLRNLYANTINNYTVGQLYSDARRWRLG